MSWRFRGLPPYLDAQGDRLGLARVLMHRARLNSEAHRASMLLGQLSERMAQLSRNEDGSLLMFPPEKAQIAATLAQADEESAKLHALAASVQAMIDEAYAAFGIEPPPRHHRVGCDFDEVSGRPDLLPIKLNGTSARTTKMKATS